VQLPVAVVRGDCGCLAQLKIGPSEQYWCAVQLGVLCVLTQHLDRGTTFLWAFGCRRGVDCLGVGQHADACACWRLSAAADYLHCCSAQLRLVFYLHPS
jgi:hypothetical protein